MLVDHSSNRIEFQEISRPVDQSHSEAAQASEVIRPWRQSLGSASGRQHLPGDSSSPLNGGLLRMTRPQVVSPQSTREEHKVFFLTVHWPCNGRRLLSVMEPCGPMLAMRAKWGLGLSGERLLLRSINVVWLCIGKRQHVKARYLLVYCWAVFCVLSDGNSQNVLRGF